MVEKLVKMGSVGWAHFDDVAVDLSTADFANFVSQLKLAESIVKDEIKTVKTTEHHKYWKNQVQSQIKSPKSRLSIL
jgi:hypothetical protein